MRNSLFAALVGIALIVGPSVSAKEYRKLVNRDGKAIHAELLEKKDGKISFMLKNGIQNAGKIYTVAIADLSDADQEFLADWKPEKPKARAPWGGGASKRSAQGPSSAYYSKGKGEIKTKVEELLAAHGGRKASEEQQATNLLNVYRYLCGVHSHVKNDQGLNNNCAQAAKICLRKGDLSHDFGHFTDRCNLSSMGDMIGSVPQYIDDAGDNNKEHRGHRRWCLNPEMGRTGFGSGGAAFSAMWSMDNSAGESRLKFWSYPGAGYFPKEHMHGTAWSYYQNGPVPSRDKLKVRIIKLKQAPERKLSSRDVPVGEEVGVRYVSTYLNTINFEPARFQAGDRGIYWVSITGGGLNVGYLVDFY